MRVNLQALGCRLNEAELQTWARQFQRQGHPVTADPEAADLVVVNTCAVTAEAVRKSRKLLRRAQRVNPRAKLVVSGCFASLDGDALAREQGIDLLVLNQDKDRLVEITARAFDLDSMTHDAVEQATNPLFVRGRQRAFVKVQDGCRHRCTFCIVTRARGEERSRPIAEVVEEINRLGTEGVKEVVLTGVHLGGYGSDGRGDLSALIRAVLADTHVPRVRLGSLEPWDLPAGFWGLFADRRLMPHLHLPLQSGSDAVLRRMARRCRTLDFARLTETARSQVADFNLTTDIIVGFPSETQAEWQQTLSFVASLGCGHLHVFPYSPRAGTKAATLPGQVHDRMKQDRSRQIRALGRRMKRETLARFVGRRLPILVEGPYGDSPQGEWFGYTPNYLPVRVGAGETEDPTNRILDLRLEAVHEDGAHLIGNLSGQVENAY
ncbi:tRNA (N(6)-L-threonylcarbamoyladenosine(37)-C(2))-methylthiotransferase MtaB [Candidatus Thiosymbion oneisti]|uniref:tRNA (N(6)-L-threonylcarbamoyladenosine(37)-C(2))- methylthiotransferase MtaB n=1 Tax=Candidatus Thiosymbion oneisti TaxID=589554 RepID=UPI000A8AEF9A|nr:tRNA (N(6)-L-threonylcarbamoyladenosine(37)-C(2))-methylthiotransferase MtaB [Candidatus Thiosymbion oneisti]